MPFFVSWAHSVILTTTCLLLHWVVVDSQFLFLCTDWLPLTIPQSDVYKYHMAWTLSYTSLNVPQCGEIQRNNFKS